MKEVQFRLCFARNIPGGRDIKKDKALVDEGWQVLRLKWKDVYSEPKKYIKLARDFVER